MIVHPERTLLTEQDLHLFNEGTHRRLYERLGGRLVALGPDAEGAHFAVWAPNAEAVSVVGDFNDWRVDDAPLEALGSSGIWAGLDERARPGHRYKFHIRSRHGGYSVAKADPFALSAETPPATASVLSRLDHEWGDAEWMARRARHNAADAPISIYEVHLGSWRRPDDPDREFLSYREMAEPLAQYATELGFSHVELLPVMEHPFYGSWGYQTTGYFAPSSRYGSPQDFMYLIDRLHQAGVGVILDWVPSHFPTDEHGLVFFDGTHLFEHADPKEGIHPDWDSAIFNYGRNEVRGFLLSSALFWLDVYHVDGLRVDAVASMLYRDYSRAAGEWIPNEYGGRENLEAMSFLRSLNEVVYAEHPDVQTFAEESTSWPMVSRPTWLGGLGFGLKWDMGWMHDTLRYFAREPVHRAYHHGELSFRMMYAFNENFTLPLSHDEVVHGKGSLLGKMPGDEWQRRANLRTLLGYMYAQPGKKLLFMGGEIGQEREWNHDAQLQWDLLEDAGHRGLQRWVADLNRVYREQPALHVHDFDPEGFQWLEVHDSGRSVYAFLRHGGGESVLVVINATPTPHENYRVGVPAAGTFCELLNSDATHYGGSGWGNLGTVESTPVPHHGLWHSLVLTLPPLSIVLLTRDDEASTA